MVVIFGGVNGYLDKLPVSEVGPFEAFFRKYIKEKHAALLEGIRKDRKMTDASTEELKKAYEGGLNAWSAAK